MLKPKQIKCLKLIVSGRLSMQEIADVCKVSRQTIYEWRKDKEFQDEHDKMLRNEIQYIAPKALRRELSLLNSKNEMVALNASKDLLDRAGFKAEDKVEITQKPIDDSFREMEAYFGQQKKTSP